VPSANSAVNVLVKSRLMSGETALAQRANSVLLIFFPRDVQHNENLARALDFHSAPQAWMQIFTPVRASEGDMVMALLFQGRRSKILLSGLDHNIIS